MSLELDFCDHILTPRKISLPSRYYYFDDQEPYIKLLSVGEGLFPNDRVCTTINITNSALILATESAAKIYPSDRYFAKTKTHFRLRCSNLEYIGDELILFQNSKLIQLLTIDFDEKSTFFYSEILSGGRSAQTHKWSCLAVKNRFVYDGDIEYLEQYAFAGEETKQYISDHPSQQNLFAKIYIRARDNEALREELNDKQIYSSAYTQNRAMIIVVILGDKISHIKAEIERVWGIYRLSLGKRQFDLGKR
ncbi:hypothetical protein AGMMS50229_11600 [Campylobacterota bacterium]|nr:hypothetical protein AGMMS50229_11600 [Campylobacterota bacterium]